MTDMTDIPIATREAEIMDRKPWSALFRQYREFYALAPSESVVQEVWSWINDREIEVHALLAHKDNQVIGFAHYRPFLRPSSGTRGIYLDDLFVDARYRRIGAGRRLLAAISEIANSTDCSVVRWITHADNTAARSLYKAVARETPWVTYDLTPGNLTPSPRQSSSGDL